MEKIIVAAIGNNGELGKDNQLLWNIPEDMKFFRQLTTGHSVVMGRKTFESIGKILPKRNNLILSRDVEKLQNQEEKGLFYFANYYNLLTFSEQYLNETKLFIIGGGQVYREMIGGADKVYLTRVHSDFEADTYFPVDILERHFEQVSSEKQSNLQYTFTFELYTRKQP